MSAPSPFAAVQAEFAGALLDPDRAVPRDLTSHSSPHPRSRFAVYRNNVVVGLTEAIRARFPAVERSVGEEFFMVMARTFVTANPPRSPILMTYGDDFPTFIAAFEPAAEIPYLADLARIEAARTRAYHAADAAPIDAARLARIDPAALAEMCFRLHPSVEVIRSDHPIVTIWRMNSGELEPAPIAEWTGEEALVARSGLDVVVRYVRPGGAQFIQSLRNGETLSQAAQATSTEPNFVLAENLADIIGAGLIVDVDFKSDFQGGER